MSRGRKAKSNNSNLSWQQIFSKNVGRYLQSLIIELGKADHHQMESGADLLQKIKAEKGKNKKEKELPPIKAEEIPYKIPDNWVWCRLGEIILSMVGGGTPSKANPSFWEGNIPWASVKDLNVKYLLDTEDKISVSAITSSSTNLIPKGNIIVCTRMGLGKIVINKIDTAINQDLKALFFSKFVNQEYFYTFYKTLEIVGKGMTVSGIRQEELLNIPIPLPPLSEQQKIVDFLTDFENDNLKEDGSYFNQEVEQKVIALHEAQLKGFEIAHELSYQLSLLKKLRQQLLQDAVQGKLVKNREAGETGQHLLNKIKAAKEQLIKAKKLKKEKELPPIKAEEIPFDIPEDWVWCRLGDICTKIGSGSTPNGSNYASEGMPFFRSQNIHNSGLDYDDIKFITDEIHKQMNGTTVYANDILLNITGGSMGRCALVPNDFEEGNVSQHVCIIRPLKVNVAFYHRLILSPFFQQNIFSSTTGAGREGLPKYNLEQFLIPLPPLSTQHRIVEKVSSLMQFCDHLEASIQTSARSNEQLLQQVLREALQG